MSEERFVVSTNTVGEIIVTDVETDRVYRYDSISNFFGLIRLLNELSEENEQLRKENERQNNEIKLLRKKIIELREDLEKIPPSIREMWFDE